MCDKFVIKQLGLLNDKIKYKFAKKRFTQSYVRVENMLILVNLSLGQLIIELYPGPTVTSEFKIQYIYENIDLCMTIKKHP